MNFFTVGFCDGRYNAARKGTQMTIQSIASTSLTGLILMVALLRSAAAAEPPAGAKPPAADAAVKPSVLLVTEDNLFLARALEANSMSRVKVVKPHDYRAANAEGFDVIVFDRFAPAALPKAGGLLFVDVLPPGGALKQSVDGKGAPLTISASGVKDWKKDHPAMKSFTPMKLYFDTARKLEIPKDWTTLLDGDKGPLIVADGDAAHRRQIVLGFDVTKSNWPLQVSFPVFILNATEYLAGR
jgi:hypothetical protein